MKVMEQPVIRINHLDFSYRPEQPLALQDIVLEVAQGERCLLVGANGAGKTTLLRIVAGRHLIARNTVEVWGQPAFHDTSLVERVTLLSGSFQLDVDLEVKEILARLAPEPARLNRLMRLLGVKQEWRMHRISDGQRRRVQLLLGLLRPCQVLLLDEITTELDLLGRAELLDFLRHESESRGLTILYATHIFDRLENWATDIAWLAEGRLRVKQSLQQLEEFQRLKQRGQLCPLSVLVEGWLRSEKTEESEAGELSEDRFREEAARR
jgi:CCR4-NOT complex subunit CAF16